MINPTHTMSPITQHRESIRHASCSNRSLALEVGFQSHGIARTMECSSLYIRYLFLAEFIFQVTFRISNATHSIAIYSLRP
jgi:hypothetical protein